MGNHPTSTGVSVTGNRRRRPCRVARASISIEKSEDDNYVSSHPHPICTSETRRTIASSTSVRAMSERRLAKVECAEDPPVGRVWSPWCTRIRVPDAHIPFLLVRSELLCTFRSHIASTLPKITSAPFPIVPWFRSPQFLLCAVHRATRAAAANRPGRSNEFV